MKLIEAEGKPHLCLFALKEITAGTEITYDYGGKEWPWRKEVGHLDFFPYELVSRFKAYTSRHLYNNEIISVLIATVC